MADDQLALTVDPSCIVRIVEHYAVLRGALAEQTPGHREACRHRREGHQPSPSQQPMPLAESFDDRDVDQRGRCGDDVE